MQVKLTHEQSGALEAIRRFLRDATADASILAGSPGPGKTTTEMNERRHSFDLG